MSAASAEYEVAPLLEYFKKRFQAPCVVFLAVAKGVARGVSERQENSGIVHMSDNRAALSLVELLSQVERPNAFQRTNIYIH